MLRREAITNILAGASFPSAAKILDETKKQDAMPVSLLPGKYTWHEQYEERMITITFQTYEELMHFIRKTCPEIYPGV